MMRGITHFDGVLPPSDWLMAFSLNAESKQTNWGWNWAQAGPLPATPWPTSLHLIPHRLPLYSQVDLLLLRNISSTIVDLAVLRQIKTNSHRADGEIFIGWKQPDGRRVMSSRCELELCCRCQVMFIQKVCNYPLCYLRTIIIIVFVCLPVVITWHRCSND